MRCLGFLRHRTLASAMAMGLASFTPSAAIADALACDQAGAATEASLGLPPGLLRAIGRVESGRRDPVSGAVAPWPWTINANGQGRYFADAATAAAAVRALQASGTVSVDIGCFQVNVMHHPLAFARIEDGFEPALNAAYAGAFLHSLRQRRGNWEAAVAAYHSATAERGEAYRARVYAAWNPASGDRGISAAAVARPAGPVVIRIAGPDLSGPDSVIRVWTPSVPGAAPARIAMPAAPVPAMRVAGGMAAGLPLAAMLPAALAGSAQETLFPEP